MEGQNAVYREVDECKKEAVDVRFITKEYILEGTVYKSIGHRFSDYLNSISDDFISLKNAKVYSVGSRELVFSLPYIGVNRSHIALVTEMEI